MIKTRGPTRLKVKFNAFTMVVSRVSRFNAKRGHDLIIIAIAHSQNQNAVYYDRIISRGCNMSAKDRLRKYAEEIMQHRAMRLADGKIWLQKWLRYHKVKRELRKIAKIKKYIG
jgi:hypothetical protein